MVGPQSIVPSGSSTEDARKRVPPRGGRRGKMQRKGASGLCDGPLVGRALRASRTGGENGSLGELAPPAWKAKQERQSIVPSDSSTEDARKRVPPRGGRRGKMQRKGASGLCDGPLVGRALRASRTGRENGSLGELAPPCLEGKTRAEGFCIPLSRAPSTVGAPSLCTRDAGGAEDGKGRPRIGAGLREPGRVT